MITIRCHEMEAYVGRTGLLVESIDDAVRSVKLDPGFTVPLFENDDITGASKTFAPLSNTWATTSRTRRRRSSCAARKRIASALASRPVGSE